MDPRINLKTDPMMVPKIDTVFPLAVMAKRLHRTAGKSEKREWAKLIV